MSSSAFILRFSAAVSISIITAPFANSNYKFFKARSKRKRGDSKKVLHLPFYGAAGFG
jgi:hypothetical protein